MIIVVTPGHDPELEEFFVRQGLGRAVGRRTRSVSGNRVLDRALDTADVMSGSDRWPGGPGRAEGEFALILDIPELRPDNCILRRQLARGW
jgi:hypothetical protein